MFEFLILGGPVVWLLVAFSILGLSVIIYKAIQCYSLRDANSHALDLVLSEYGKGNLDGGIALGDTTLYSRGWLIISALNLTRDGQLSPEQVKEETKRLAKKAIEVRLSYLRILEVLATLSPLLGLFGTVLGMISAFQAMEAAGSQVNPAVLSGGIWLALLTTAIGVAVAIPLSIANSFFERRCEGVAAQFQDDIANIVTLWARNRVKQHKQSGSYLPNYNFPANEALNRQAVKFASET